MELNIQSENALKNYANSLESLRPDFIRMIYDSYSEFNYEELENCLEGNTNDKTEKSNLSTKNLHSNNKLTYTKTKGFYSSQDQYLRGNEYEEWNQIINKILKSTEQESKMRTNLEIQQYDYLKPDQIPKKPEKKLLLNNQKLYQNYNFKSNKEGYKTISFSKTVNIKTEKLGKMVKDIVSHHERDDMIKLVDTQKENRIVFIEKIEFNYLGNQTILSENINIQSLEKRGELLTQSRYSFIQKISLIINKFIISLKKLYKKKKDKEKLLINKQNNILINQN